MTASLRHGGSSPITVLYLTNGVPYTFTVTATNSAGTQHFFRNKQLDRAATYSDAPTIGTATGGSGQATVTFTAPINNGGSSIIRYTVTTNDGLHSGTGGSSPITVLGLTNGTTYTFTSRRRTPSAPAHHRTSNSVVPAGPPDARRVYLPRGAMVKPRSPSRHPRTTEVRSIIVTLSLKRRTNCNRRLFADNRPRFDQRTTTPLR